MKKTIGMLCCLAVLSVQTLAQDRLEVRKGPGRREFRQGVRDTFQYAGRNDALLLPILGSYERSGTIYYGSRVMKAAGRILVFGGVTGLMLGGGLAANRNRPVRPAMPHIPGQLQLNFGTASPEFIRGCLIGGLVGLSAGISLLIVSERRLHGAVEVYNSRPAVGEPSGMQDRGADLRLGITPHGAGMILSW